MSRQLLVVIAAAALGLTACGDSASPTSAGRDLLQDASGVPALEGSKYGQIEVVEAVEDTAVAPPAVLYHIAGGPRRSEYARDGEHRFHITDGPSRSIYTIRQQYHIASGADASRYVLGEGTVIDWIPVPSDDPLGPPMTVEPIVKHHITSGPRRSEYAVDGEHRFHITDGPSQSIYTIKQQYHVASGADASTYRRVP